MQTRFSQRLSWLMKKRKISGQKIGDAIGKSQKTISRYANGEVNPSNDIKNKIYRVIADISGIEEDATTEEELSENQWSLEEMVGEYEIQVAIEDREEGKSRFEYLKEVFEQLTTGAKKYYIKNIDKFHLMEDWEYDVMEIYHSLTEKQQEKLLQYLEPTNFNFSLLKNCKKIAAYFALIEISERRPLLVKADSDLNEDKSIQGRINDEWINKIAEMEYDPDMSNVYIPYYPSFIRYTPHDWYFLLRLQIFELNDKEKYLWGDKHGDKHIGSKLFCIMRAIEEGYF